MTRSVWKGPYIAPCFFRKNKKKSIQSKVYSRNSTILPEFVGKTMAIHNGHKFINLLINEEMVGHKFGEFSLTRQIRKK